MHNLLRLPQRGKENEALRRRLYITYITVPPEGAKGPEGVSSSFAPLGSAARRYIFVGFGPSPLGTERKRSGPKGPEGPRCLWGRRALWAYIVVPLLSCAPLWAFREKSRSARALWAKQAGRNIKRALRAIYCGRSARLPFGDALHPA